MSAKESAESSRKERKQAIWNVLENGCGQVKQTLRTPNQLVNIKKLWTNQKQPENV